MDWKRAGSTAFIVLVFFCVGIEQRLWSAHLKIRADPQAQAGADLKSQLQDQQARLQDELDKLPPDSKKFFQDLFFDARQDMLVSPVIRSMQGMTFGASDPDEAALSAQRRYESFKRFEGALETAWWIVGGAAIVWCAAVWLLGKEKLGVRFADACLSVSSGWFFALSCASAFWAGLSLKNPWLALPSGFYLAPVAASAAAFLADQAEESMLRAGAALLAPAICLVLSALAAALA